MKVKKLTMTVIGVIILLIVDYPIINVLLSSFKTTPEIMRHEGFLPKKLSFENYELLYKHTKFFIQMRNSLIVSVAGTICSVLIASLAGYAISRFRRVGFALFSRSLLVVQMFPLVLITIPLFITFSALRLINSLTAMIILYTTFTLPFTIWLFRGYFDSIPVELEEAATIDGATRTQILVRIIIPLSGPGIGAVAIFSFLLAWNEYLIASTFLKSSVKRTVTVGMAEFIRQYGADWASIMTAATCAMIPSIIIFLFLQRYFISGHLTSGLKG